MRRSTKERFFLWIVAVGLPAIAATPAVAYVGPGAGLSLLGALWGVVIAIGAAIGFVILWPLRKMLRKNRAAGSERAQPASDSPASGTARAAREDVSRHGAV